MREWRPLPDLARAAGVAESTCRRYARGVAQPFLPIQSHGRFVLYDLAVGAPILRRVAELYRRGRTQEQVAESLAREFMPVVELEAPDALVAVERHQPPRDPAGAFAPALAEIMAAYNQIRAELDVERQARAALETKMGVLEAELVASKRRAREFEQVVEGKLKR